MAVIEIEQGATLVYAAQAEDENGQPLDLTGHTVDLVDGSGNPTSVASIADLDLAAGTFTIRSAYDASRRSFAFHVRLIQPNGDTIIWPQIRVFYK